ncbi:MAG: hypothetical protein CMJ83_11370 [Planctomycetes bacterium]|nr:hypothetical protein [Planctomycetota bacterium]
MTRSFAVRRVVIVLLFGAVIAMTVALWTNNPWDGAFLLAADLFVMMFLVAGWRQIAQQERDAEEIAMRQESQRRHAAAMPREDRREIAPAPRPAVPEEEDDD